MIRNSHLTGFEMKADPQNAPDAVFFSSTGLD
jgi:hypothetical protein